MNTDSEYGVSMYKLKAVSEIQSQCRSFQLEQKYDGIQRPRIKPRSNGREERVTLG
jgi:hypothetical protein